MSIFKIFNQYSYHNSTFFKEAQWSVIGSVVSSASTIIIAIICARFLGASDYGAFSIVQNTLTVVVVSISAALGITATKYLSEYIKIDQKRANVFLRIIKDTSLVFSLIFSLIFVLFSTKISNYMFGNIDFSNIIRIASVTLFFSSLNGVQLGILSGFRKFKNISAINAARGIVTILCIVAFTPFAGLTGAVFAYAISSIIVWIFSNFNVQRAILKLNIHKIIKYSFSEFKVIFNYSFPVMISSILFAFTNWVSFILLSRLPNGLKEVGIFNAACQWRWVVIFISISLSSVFVSRMAENIGNKKFNSFRKEVTISFVLIILSAILPAIILFRYAEFISMLFGKEFSQSMIIPIQYLAIATIFDALSNACIYVIQVVGNIWVRAFIHLLWAITLLAFLYNYLFLGAIGLSIAYIISYVVQFSLLFLYTIYLLNNTPHTDAKCLS